MNFIGSKEIRLKLIEEMKSGEYSEKDRLPRETTLAEHFGISRTHLRDILAQLEREGFITRRHGIGTIINHHVLNVKNRMDIETEFLDIIRKHGNEADISYIDVTTDAADEYIAEKLQIAEGTEIVRVLRICTADGKPVIYCEDIIEKNLIKYEYTSDDFRNTFFEFLSKFCGIEAYMDLTQLHGVVADGDVAVMLEVPVGTPLLNMEEVDYDIDGNIIFYSRQYFINEAFEQTVLRKKL